MRNMKYSTVGTCIRNQNEENAEAAASSITASLSRLVIHQNRCVSEELTNLINVSRLQQNHNISSALPFLVVHWCCRSVYQTDPAQISCLEGGQVHVNRNTTPLTGTESRLNAGGRTQEANTGVLK